MTATLPPCQHEGCGHSPDDHRLDDALNVSPVDPAAKFRCVWRPRGRSIAWQCTCPDYTRLSE